MSQRETPKMKLYTIQVLVKGEWQYGPRFYGVDTITGIVGPHFVASFEWALEEAKKIAKYSRPGYTRVVSCTLDDEPVKII